MPATAAAIAAALATGARTPGELVLALYVDLKPALRPAHSAAMDSPAVTDATIVSGPREFGDFLIAQNEKFRKLIDTAGLRNK